MYRTQDPLFSPIFHCRDTPFQVFLQLQRPYSYFRKINHSQAQFSPILARDMGDEFDPKTTIQAKNIRSVEPTCENLYSTFLYQKMTSPSNVDCRLSIIAKGMKANRRGEYQRDFFFFFFFYRYDLKIRTRLRNGA